MAVFPSFQLNDIQQNEVLKVVRMISRELDIHGLLNIQFVLRDNVFWIVRLTPEPAVLCR